jgi:predicted secreted hydrolase
LFQYRPALPGYVYQFPRDHGSHSEYKLEWWYYTGHLRADGGREFGYELTFFRAGVDNRVESASAWTINDLYMAHFAITDIAGGQFLYEEKLNRAGPGIAGAAKEDLDVWNENWSARGSGEKVMLRAKGKSMAVDLVLDPLGPPVIHGTDGVSQKAAGEGHSSHYYSIPRLKTEGTLVIGDLKFSVTGESWMDHEFGTNQLGQSQIGWDWFGLQLDNGINLMLYRMRNSDGSIDAYSSGTIMDGDARHLDRAAFSATPLRTWTSGKTGTAYPVEWTISIPSQSSELRVTPLLEDQELVTTRSTGIAYWEGAVRVSGTWRGKPVEGRGYLELTGYLEKYRPRV